MKMAIKALGDVFGAVGDAEHGEFGEFVEETADEAQELFAFGRLEVEAGFVEEEQFRRRDEGTHDEDETDESRGECAQGVMEAFVEPEGREQTMGELTLRMGGGEARTLFVKNA
jgi:hypothetical protein